MLETLRNNTRRDEPTLLDGHRYAAVAAILTGKTEAPELLFIRRSERDQDPWSGQMAFPGGKREVYDISLMHTAMREVHEEIGLQLSTEQCVGRLSELRATARGIETGLIVVPYVFWLPGLLPPLLATDEVTETVQIEVGRLRGAELRTTYPYQHSGDVLHFPAFNVHERLVWGMTYRMTEQLLHASASEG